MSEATVSEEQVLHNELSFEINQELIHLMKRIVEIQRVNQQLKDNWNKLKEYIRKNIIYDDVGMKILDPSPLEDYMQELEQGKDD